MYSDCAVASHNPLADSQSEQDALEEYSRKTVDKWL